MVDSTKALTYFQEAYTSHNIVPQRCDVHKDTWMWFDEPLPNQKCFSYALIEASEVLAHANLSLTNLFERKTVFQIGYAVPTTHRNKGLGRRVAKIAIDEIDNGFRRAKTSPFKTQISLHTGSLKASSEIANNQVLMNAQMIH